MSWTKRELITAAYTELGMANYVFDLEPDQLQTAVLRMDSLFAHWEGMGIHLGYATSDTPGSANLDTPSGIPGYANAAAYLGLALILAPSVGKNISPITAAGARATYLGLLRKSMVPTIEKQLPGTMPRGAGHKDRESPFVDAPTDPIDTGPEGQLDLFN